MKILSRLKIEGGSGFKLRKFNMKYFPSKENSDLTDKQITGISKAAAFSPFKPEECCYTDTTGRNLSEKLSRITYSTLFNQYKQKNSTLYANDRCEVEKISYVIPILDDKGKKRNITFALLDVLYEKLDPKFKELSPYEQMGRGASMIEITLLVIRPDEVKYVEQFLNEFQNKKE